MESKQAIESALRQSSKVSDCCVHAQSNLQLSNWLRLIVNLISSKKKDKKKTSVHLLS